MWRALNKHVLIKRVQQSCGGRGVRGGSCRRAGAQGDSVSFPQEPPARPHVHLLQHTHISPHGRHRDQGQWQDLSAPHCAPDVSPGAMLLNRAPISPIHVPNTFSYSFNKKSLKFVFNSIPQSRLVEYENTFVARTLTFDSTFPPSPM